MWDTDDIDIPNGSWPHSKHRKILCRIIWFCRDSCCLDGLDHGRSGRFWMWISFWAASSNILRAASFLVSDFASPSWKVVSFSFKVLRNSNQASTTDNWSVTTACSWAPVTAWYKRALVKLWVSPGDCHQWFAHQTQRKSQVAAPNLWLCCPSYGWVHPFFSPHVQPQVRSAKNPQMKRSWMLYVGTKSASKRSSRCNLKLLWNFLVWYEQCHVPIKLNTGVCVSVCA